MDRNRVGSDHNTATLSDVARLAGVSTATASKALNGRDQVKAETRERVFAAAQQLSFTPNPFARALNDKRTGTIGMLTSDLDNRFVLPVLLGAEDAFGAGATSVLLCDARGDAIREQHHLRTLLARRVDGIVILGRTTNPRPSISQGIPVPVVYAYAPSDDDADTSFTPDNYLAGKLAVEHLLGSRAHLHRPDQRRTLLFGGNGQSGGCARRDGGARTHPRGWRRSLRSVDGELGTAGHPHLA